MNNKSTFFKMLEQSRHLLDDTPLPSGYPFVDSEEIELRAISLMVSTSSVEGEGIIDQEWHPSLMPWVEQIRLKRYAQWIVNRAFGLGFLVLFDEVEDR